MLVTAVTPGSPAARAGIRRGEVVASIDGVEVSSRGELRNRIAAAGAGAHVRIEIVRDDSRRALDVVLAELRDEPRRPPAGRARPSWNGLAGGVSLAPLDPTTRNQLEVPTDITDGLVVTDVEPGSPMAHAAVQPGDLILEVDRHPVASADGLGETWARRQGLFALLVWRGGHYLYLVAER